MKANDAQKEYLTPQELASKLGMALKTITNWTQSKRVPGSVKIGGRWRSAPGTGSPGRASFEIFVVCVSRDNGERPFRELWPCIQSLEV